MRQVEAIDTWFPFVSHCRLKHGAAADQVGAVRAKTVAGGAVIEETLVETVMATARNGPIPRGEAASPQSTSLKGIHCGV